MDGTAATAPTRADDGGAADLYKRDFVAWTAREAARLRAAAAARGTDLPVDWANVAEEIESLGRRDARELESRLATIAEHLHKLARSALRDPRAGWEATVRRERLEVRNLLRQSPSLRPRLAATAAEAARDGGRLAAAALASYGEPVGRAEARAMAEGGGLTEERMLGDWLPGAPGGDGGAGDPSP